ncbi:MAG: hydantoinase/oxoprolinase family protein [Alphaproteobacteria bacterium]|nr:hydantoinase/oxoprolinase family protein [Alphaproteobacteria bacterium]
MQWVGVDVGGTFTDAVVYDDAKRAFRYAKAPSTPGDPTGGVLDVLDRLQLDMDQVERFVHGVTIGTNAVLEGKGATVWMLTTAGFRDVMEIARTNRPVLYNIKSLKTPPLVPRTRTYEVDERMLYDGSIKRPLDEAELRRTLARMPTGPNDALAICFLHSYANPAHERAAKRAVEASNPGWFVCTSAEVLPQFREYDRFSTTVLNAYLGPLMANYLDRLQAGLAAKRYRRDVYIMTSNGGVSTVERAKRLPIGTVLSGPAGGVAASIHLGRLLGRPNLITCDMGGTSTDVCLIEGLRVPVTNEQSIAGYSNRTPQIEINAVGAGGGSIAWLDAGGILNVGPQSAGAAPGPACYGRGGTEPTVTDANLVLGRLDPGNRLAGRIALDPELAMAAIRRLGERLLGLGDHALAEGIVRIAVARMVSAIKQISISNGFDPRDFTLLAYGGAGPMHAVAIAEELEMRSILVPLGPGNFAAFGSLISDLRRDYAQTRTLQLRETTWAEVEATFARIEAEARESLRGEGVPAERIVTRRSAGMRYLGQSWELSVEVPPAIASLPALEAAFGEVHDRRFGHKSGGNMEVVSFRVAAIGEVAKPSLPDWTVGGTLVDALQARRPVFFAGAFADAPVYQRDRLPKAARIGGPAVIEESGSTTVLPVGWHASVLQYGDLLVERGET